MDEIHIKYDFEVSDWYYSRVVPFNYEYNDALLIFFWAVFKFALSDLTKIWKFHLDKSKINLKAEILRVSVHHLVSKDDISPTV